MSFVRLSPVGSIMRDVDQWKALVLVLVVIGVASAIYTPNFDEVVMGNGSSYGVKAALCALGATTLAFTSVIPSGASNRRRDIELRVASAISAGLSGVFWLMGETGGKILATISLAAPFFAVLYYLVFLGVTLNILRRTVTRSNKEVEAHVDDDADGEAEQKGR